MKKLHANPGLFSRSTDRSLPNATRRVTERAKELLIHDTYALLELQDQEKNCYRPERATLVALGLGAACAVGTVLGLGLTGIAAVAAGVGSLLFTMIGAQMAGNMILASRGEKSLERFASRQIQSLAKPYQAPETPRASRLPAPWGELQTQGLLEPDQAPVPGPLPLDRPALTSCLDKLEEKGITFLPKPGSKKMRAGDVVDRIAAGGTDFPPLYVYNRKLGSEQTMEAICTLSDLQAVDALYGNPAASPDPVLATLRELEEKGVTFHSSERPGPLNALGAFLMRPRSRQDAVHANVGQEWLRWSTADDLAAIHVLLGQGDPGRLEHPGWFASLRAIGAQGYGGPTAVLGAYQRMREEPHKVHWLGQEGHMVPVSGDRLSASPDGAEWVARSRAVQAKVDAFVAQRPGQLHRAAQRLMEHTMERPLAVPWEVATDFALGMMPPEKDISTVTNQLVPGQLARLEQMPAHHLQALAGLAELLPPPLALAGAETVAAVPEKLAERVELYTALQAGAFGPVPEAEIPARLEQLSGDAAAAQTARKAVEAERLRKKTRGFLGSNQPQEVGVRTGVRELANAVSLGGVMLAKRRLRT